MPNDVRHGVSDSTAAPSHATFPAIAMVGAGLVLGAAVAARTLRRPHAQGREDARARTNALATYLREHLSGADAAIRVVERLRQTHAGTAEGRLFAALFVEFQRDREVVLEMFADVGASSWSAKRLVAGAGGVLIAPIAGGATGDLALFRTLEGLALGVPGKRLLWRAMQDVEPEFTQVSRSRLRELETLAMRQWEAIEERRRALTRSTFARQNDT